MDSVSVSIFLLIKMGTTSAHWYFNDDRASCLPLLACAVSTERQQQEPVELQADDDPEDVESDAGTDDIGTLSRSNHVGLKRRFLDRLAEGFARQKRPVNFVSCTALVERADEVSIFVSRNRPFTGVDVIFKKGLAACLEQLSKGMWDAIKTYTY